MTRREAVAVWCRRWRALKTWGRELEELTVTVRERSEEVGDYSTGRCWPTMRRVVVTAGADMPDALATILHEYAHAVAPGDEHHGARWQAIFAASVAEVTTIRIASTADDFHLIDREATLALREWWKFSGNEFAWNMINGHRGKR